MTAAFDDGARPAHGARRRGPCGCVEEREWVSDDPGAPEVYRTVVDFLAPVDEPVSASAIVCFGSRDMHVPIRAAELYHDGVAPVVVCTGGVELTGGVSEADAFAAELARRGVPADRIVIERESSHTGDNVVLGMAALRQRTAVASVVAVAWPFVARRCVATFARHEPRVLVRSVPAFCRPHLPAPLTPITARWSVEQLDRLVRYSARGLVARLDVPAPVAAAAERLRPLGTRDLAGSALAGGPDGPGVHGVLEPIGEGR